VTAPRPAGALTPRRGGRPRPDPGQLVGAPGVWSAMVDGAALLLAGGRDVVGVEVVWFWSGAVLVVRGAVVVGAAVVLRGALLVAAGALVVASGALVDGAVDAGA
jgi:hypothetical protein